MTYQVLARKWRPQAFDAVVGQDPVTRTLRNALASGRVAHAYLFTGPRGVGKTTTARLLAKALACTARTGTEACGACPSCRDFASGAPVDVMEIDAASNTSVDDIRTLRENVKYSPARGRFKVYIVDEVHMLSGAAFNAFLKTLEEPPGHVVFILATTDPKKIPATVLSRCQRFDFRPIPPELLTASLTQILEQEGVSFEPGALPVLIRAAEGSLRDALSLLDTAIAYGEGTLDEASVARLLGSSSPVHVRGFVGALIARDGAAALEAVDRAASAGEDLGTLCREAIEMTRRLLVVKVAPGAPFADLTPAEGAELRSAAEPVSADELVYVLRAFLDADVEMRRSPHPRVELEIAAVRATRRPEPQAIETLIGKLEEAEARLRQMPAAAGGAARAVMVQETLLDARPAAPAPAPRAASPAGSAPPPPGPAAPAAPRAPSSSMGPPAGSTGRARPPEAEPLIETAAADIEAAEIAPVPAGDLEMAWERVVSDVLKRKALLGSVLQHASPLRVEQGVLTLALQASGFHREMLNDRGNKEMINEAVQRHVASARRFELDARATAPAGAGGARNHPAVQAALSTFQGEVVAVRPRSPEEGESR
ncbi:MAG TPA: DNA polymerase III subunit gamma/tau [Candidatus Nitrosotalea sp.]|nr:DNA polymerase III subunit gamma/tau [Candidatus Nitrosotalea sp.]